MDRYSIWPALNIVELRAQLRGDEIAKIGGLLHTIVHLPDRNYLVGAMVWVGLGVGWGKGARIPPLRSSKHVQIGSKRPADKRCTMIGTRILGTVKGIGS